MHQESLEPVIRVVRERDVRGASFAGRIEQRRMPQLARLVSQTVPAPHRMHVTPQHRDAKFLGQRDHMLRVAVRVGPQVMVHVHRNDRAAR